MTACFPAGTPVAVADGFKPIEDVEVGDLVWSWHEETGNLALKPVTQTMRRDSDALVELQIGADTLRATPEQFWANGAWKVAGELETGDALLRSDGQTMPVRAVAHHTDEPTPVYNLEVADWHTYFAGPWHLLAHNKCDALTELVDIGAGVFIKRLKPNTTYVRNGYEYATDAYGRIKKVAGDLRIEPKATRDRSDYMQGIAGKGDGRLADDAGGHLIGDQFGGVGNNANLVAMKHQGVNAYHTGTWGKMEKSWAQALKDGKKVKVDIEPIYKDASARPHSFEVTQWIDGVESQRTINNF